MLCECLVKGGVVAEVDDPKQLGIAPPKCIGELQAPLVMAIEDQHHVRRRTSGRIRRASKLSELHRLLNERSNQATSSSAWPTKAMQRSCRHDQVPGAGTAGHCARQTAAATHDVGVALRATACRALCCPVKGPTKKVRPGPSPPPR
eukprot:CAMPEP_0203908782 /NCGR_PEP_ID=MMETSP0359-20131031/50158_1 /ASSEMBLY_ACC=CAM_ASM_000338 /TAXON_ID=268821 /ORGANISM="Scrippsiella Hangoei, Strain SHTV-5" /LENGTH=146 /DNA_ID=CAMNT_0050833861 /DNA_START=250 /DNA_END=686 /DNA_ORIENTATION=-